MTPAPSRRPTMPAALSSATADDRERGRDQRPGRRLTASGTPARSPRSVTRPSTQADADGHDRRRPRCRRRRWRRSAARDARPDPAGRSPRRRVSSLPVTGPPYDQAVTITRPHRARSPSPTCSTSSARTRRRCAATGPPATSPPTSSSASAGRTRCPGSRSRPSPAGPSRCRTRTPSAPYAELVRAGAHRPRPAVAVRRCPAPTSCSTPPSTSCTTRTSAARSAAGSRGSSRAGAGHALEGRSRPVPRSAFRGVDAASSCAAPTGRRSRRWLARAPAAARSPSPGEPLELLLYLFGRREHAQVTLTGDTAAVTAAPRSRPVGLTAQRGPRPVAIRIVAPRRRPARDGTAGNA